LKAGFKPENIYVSLESHMKCGIGSKDGPVFTYAEKLALEGG